MRVRETRAKSGCAQESGGVEGLLVLEKRKNQNLNEKQRTTSMQLSSRKVREFAGKPLRLVFVCYLFLFCFCFRFCFVARAFDFVCWMLGWMFAVFELCFYENSQVEARQSVNRST